MTATWAGTALTVGTAWVELTDFKRQYSLNLHDFGFFLSHYFVNIRNELVG